MGLCGGKIQTTGDNAGTVMKNVAEMLLDDDSEFLNIYYGADTDETEAETLASELEDKYPELEIAVKYGGQPLYYYIISVE